jgi:hypothetical protein
VGFSGHLVFSVPLLSFTGFKSKREALSAFPMVVDRGKGDTLFWKGLRVRFQTPTDEEAKKE